MDEQSEPACAAELGMFLRHVRERRDLSPDALAAQLGINRRYIYQIESGTPTPYTRRLLARLRLLDVRMEVHAR